jgi:hypothetical protein
MGRGRPGESTTPSICYSGVRYLNGGYGYIMLLLVFNFSFFLERMLGFFPFFPIAFVFTSLVWHIGSSLVENISAPGVALKFQYPGLIWREWVLRVTPAEWLTIP